jgi:hypothetical protein
MIRDGTKRSFHRCFVALLAAWMAVFAVASVVHNHGLPHPIPQSATLEQPGTGAIQPASVCLACLASHVPAPAPAGQTLLAAPQVVAGVLSVGPVLSHGFQPLGIASPRAPPSPLFLAA